MMVILGPQKILKKGIADFKTFKNVSPLVYKTPLRLTYPVPSSHTEIIPCIKKIVKRGIVM